MSGSCAPRLRSPVGRLDGRWAVLLGSGTSGRGSAPCSPGPPARCSWSREKGGKYGGWLSVPLHLHIFRTPSPNTLTLGHTGYSTGQTADAGSPRCLCRSSPGRSERSHKVPLFLTHPLPPGKGPTWALLLLGPRGGLSDSLGQLALCRPRNVKEKACILPPCPPRRGSVGADHENGP